jgi:hypothetical protein
MRKYILDTVSGMEYDSFKQILVNHNIEKIELIPIIGAIYDIGGVSLRCSEHKRGMAVLKNTNIVVKLIEVNA